MVMSGEQEDCYENEDISQSLTRSTRTRRTPFVTSTLRKILLLLAACASVSSKTIGQAATDLDSGVILAKKEDPHEQHRKEDLIGRDIQPRVVGGSDAARGFYPYFVRIDVNHYPRCGGSLVAPDVVLTAAHCKDEQMSVIVNGYHGSLEVNDDQRFRYVEYMLQHPEYNDMTFHKDLMLLKLHRPVNIIPYVKLNQDITKPAVRDTVIVMGLGAIAEGGNVPDTLQAAEVEVVDHTECSRAYEKIGMVINEDIMLCAGSRTGATDSCQGDSGGPLIDSRGYQVGLVSFGYGCARLDYPGVYARTVVGNGVDSWLGENICNMTTADDPPEFC
jgi:secreted trypsin-like serine protease